MTEFVFAFENVGRSRLKKIVDLIGIIKKRNQPVEVIIEHPFGIRENISDVVKAYLKPYELYSTECTAILVNILQLTDSIIWNIVMFF